MDDNSRNGHVSQTPGHADRLQRAAAELRCAWDENPRFAGIERRYEAEEVVRLRGSVTVEHSLARAGAERLW